jgi:pyruvate kinase
MARTKIVCTIGPVSRSPETLEQLIRAGMDVARLNFSHGTQVEHLEVITAVRRIAQRLGRSVAILQDLAGLKIRIGEIASGGHAGSRRAVHVDHAPGARLPAGGLR